MPHYQERKFGGIASGWRDQICWNKEVSLPQFPTKMEALEEEASALKKIITRKFEARGQI